MKIQNLIFFLYFCSLFYKLIALGSGSTLSISYGNPTVCGIVASETNHHIQCYNHTTNVLVQPNISYDLISGGQNFFCGLRSGGQSLLCWDTNNFSPKRIYFNSSFPLREISVGNNHVCGIVNFTNQVYCWRLMKNFVEIPIGVGGYLSISSGIDFSCGIYVNNNQIIVNNSITSNFNVNVNISPPLSSNPDSVTDTVVSGRVKCWGSNSSSANEIEEQFNGYEMISITAGGKHVCGFNLSGILICKGSNLFGQLDFPFDLNESIEYSRLALGFDYSCAIRDSNGSVLCWGGGGKYSSNLTKNVEFETLIGGYNFTCGLITRNFSVFCWGPGWTGNASLGGDKILPGPCVQSECSQCGIVPGSQSLCFGSGNICNVCGVSSQLPPFTPLSPPVVSRTSKGLKKGLLAFAIVGSIGAFAGICSIVYCLYIGVCFRRKKVHNSVQPTITRGGSSTGRNNSSSSPPSRSMTVRRQGSRIIRRQRSGTSSMKHVDRAEEFTFQELALATDDFSMENKIGSGSFGVVYRGKLPDGREVAIKRGETSKKTKKYQEKESAFDSELAFLSRVHHKHLVRLVGYCEERDERLLVYDYMKNGALYDHLHDKNNVEKGNSLINSWKMRIRIALDASRGIEYLHNYAVPPIIHRDIKSSNILLDIDWTARVSDFGLSLMRPESGRDFRPTKAAGTVGYIDPEYYGLNVLTAKSDVYGLGVVLLELLTGKRAIFKDDTDGGTPVSVVDYAVPAILAGELLKILDQRVGFPGSNESEAVELVAYTALHCVNLEGKDRPTMTDIVGNLERAISLCDESHGSISSAGMSIGSD
ncbi:putative serine/threonine-protein kinase-like protein CCR3 [Silene latifolia]|uniref:putative serine/threonine-protein kinase-like protein CCR3 n=1 Tax=Silene latifolia TaxID=37657 RepID=UPI003D785D7E